MEVLTRTQRKQLLHEEIKHNRSAVLIVNARARRGRKWFQAAKRYLQEAGFRLSCYEIKDPARLPEVVAHAVKSGAKFVIVGGGDGTISSVVGYVARRDVVLGILPLGTGNSFARTIGLPLSLKGAVDNLINGKVVDVDLGIKNGDYFANLASIGFNAQVVHQTPDALKRLLGVFAYLFVGCRELLRSNLFTCELEIDGSRCQFDTRQVIIANGAFYGVSRITPSASAEDRLLRVCVLDSKKRWGIVRLWLGLMKGEPAAFGSVRVFKSRRVVCHTNPPQVVDIDGELTAGTPLSIGVAPQALLVMAPQDFVDT